MNNFLKLAILCLFVGLIACSDDILEDEVELLEQSNMDLKLSVKTGLDTRSVPCTLDLEAVSNCCIAFDIDAGPYDFFIDYGDGHSGDDTEHCYEFPGTYNIVLYTMDDDDNEMCSVTIFQTVLGCEEDLCDSFICWDDIEHQEYDCVGGITVQLPNGDPLFLDFEEVDLDLGYGVLAEAIEKAFLEAGFDLSINSTGSQDNCLGIFISSELKVLSLDGDNCQGGPIGPGSVFESECNPQEVLLETVECGFERVTYNDCCVSIELSSNSSYYSIDCGDCIQQTTGDNIIECCFEEDGLYTIVLTSYDSNSDIECTAETEVNIDQCDLACSSDLCWVDMLGQYDCVMGFRVKIPGDDSPIFLEFSNDIDTESGINDIVAEMYTLIQNLNFEVTIETHDADVVCHKPCPLYPDGDIKVGFFVESPLMIIDFVGSDCNGEMAGYSTEFTSDCGY